MEQVLVQQVVSRCRILANRADYQLTAKLDEKNNEISGTGIITHK
jgi:hypothetical protein